MITKEELEKKIVKYFILWVKSLGRKTILRSILESVVPLCILSQFSGLIGKHMKEVCVWAGGGAKRQDWSGGYWNQNKQAVFCLRKKHSVRG